MSHGLNVIHVARRFVRDKWGGTETAILETCRQLRAMGHANRIVCPCALSVPGYDQCDGVPILREPYFYPYWGLDSASRTQLDMRGGNLFSFDLMKRLRTMPNIDLLHLHTGKRLGGIVRTVARQRRIPYVVTLHGGVTDVPPEERRALMAPTRRAWEWGRVLGWWVGSRRVLRDAAAILVISRTEEERLRETCPDSRIEYLPHGVEASRFETGDGARFRKRYGIRDSVKMLLNVGRIDPQKNQRLALQLLPRLLAERHDTHLTFIGHVTDDDYFRQLRAYCRELGVAGRVTIIPGFNAESKELVDAYHAADLFLLPSQHEPFGIVVLEAWAAGLPVVASHVGGIPGFVRNGSDGLLVGVDDRESWFRAIDCLLTQPTLRERLARNGRNRAIEEFSWKSISQRLLTIYESVVREQLLEARR
ncbi:MAG: glycosyltransferase family 4 protein [Planctomycetales bacterium]|nr:glycosyltransferase family 4 protein [Planctomycetales bacterium]